MEYSIEDFLEEFNDGDLDVEKYFNDYETFFSILDRRGLMSEVDPINGAHADDWQNSYMLWLYENDSENFYKWVGQILDDVEFVDGVPYLVIKDRGDLATLFCDGRHFSKDTVENILSMDSDWYDYFDNSTDDVYRDVIEELDKKNIERLKERVISDLENKQLSPETELMEEIAKEQGHPDYWTIDLNNVSRIIDDEKSMNSLLDDELSDIKSELYSVHSSAYNSAYENEIYQDVWNELDDYFEGKGSFEMRPHPYKKDTKVEYFKVKIRDMESILIDFLSDNKNYGSSGTLGYWGSLLGVMGEQLNCLSPKISDYPDSREVDKNINEYFRDYI
jgi:hypothetical protein